MKRIATSTLAAVLLVVFSASTFAASADTSKQTPEQKLAIWLKAPAQQQWDSKKLIGEQWWQLMASLPLNKAEQMWSATVKTQDPDHMSNVARRLATKKKNFKEAKAYYQHKLKTPASAQDKEAKKLWQRAQDNRYQLVRLLIHFAKKGNLKQETINKEALEITGGKIQRAQYGIRLLRYVTGEAKAKLLLNAIHKYGDNPNQMTREGGLLNHLREAVNNKTISHDKALSAVTKAKAKTDKKLAMTKPSDEDYKELKEYSSKLTALYEQLSS